MKINKLSLLGAVLVLAAGFVMTGCGASENDEAVSLTGKADPAETPTTKGEGGGKGGLTPPGVKADGS